MSGADIAAEIAEALSEAGEAVGQGEYIATLTRKGTESASDPNAGTPWGDAATGNEPEPDTYDVTILDEGSKTRHNRDDKGVLVPRTARVLTIAATGEAPQMGDVITLADGKHEIASVNRVAPGGVALLFEVELKQ
ncbi:MAG: hypothetical protein CML69_15565 [Rhodobacteraceae bacterium]|nr:hypothetical protein [Paracoccaceae bacterium]